MTDLRRARERHPDLPRVVLVHQGSVEQGEDFLASRWPEVVALSDPDLHLYTAFGLGRGKVGQLLGLASMKAGVRALCKGNLVGLPVGDPWVMPGLFLCDGDRILWQHEFGHAGDLPPEEKMAASVREALQASRASGGAGSPSGEPTRAR